MIKLLYWLIVGHIHKWKIIQEEVLNYTSTGETGVCQRYTLQCEHCGNIKTKDAK